MSSDRKALWRTCNEQATSGSEQRSRWGRLRLQMEGGQGWGSLPPARPPPPAPYCEARPLTPSHLRISKCVPSTVHSSTPPPIHTCCAGLSLSCTAVLKVVPKTLDGPLPPSLQPRVPLCFLLPPGLQPHRLSFMASYLPCITRPLHMLFPPPGDALPSPFTWNSLSKPTERVF